MSNSAVTPGGFVGILPNAPDVIYNFGAGFLTFPVTAPAVLNTRTLTNGTFKEYIFDDTNASIILGEFRMPNNITGYANISLDFDLCATTAASGKYVQMQFSFSACGNTEDADIAFSSVDSGDIAITNTQDALDQKTVTAAITSFGFVANDLVRFKIKRIAPVGSALVGNLGMRHFRIRVTE